MSKVQVFSPKANKVESMDFPKDRLVEPNLNLLSQANFVFEDRSHGGTSKSKTRSEVNATGAKMYKQKGTGNARHGDRKAPIFKGGGTAHGPHGIKKILSLSKNLKRKALGMALSFKVKEANVVIADKLDALKKTKEAQLLLNNILSNSKSYKAGSKIVLALSSEKKELVKVFRNIKNVIVTTFKGLGMRDVMHSGIVIIDKDAFNDKEIIKNNDEKKEISLKKAGEKTVKQKTTKKEVKKVAKKTVKKN